MEEVDRKLREYRTLTNRLNRYWKKLVVESLRTARDLGLVTGATQLPFYYPYDITIKRNGDDVDVTELLELAKSRFPSLHRRYEDGMTRHRTLRSELNGFLDNL